MAMPMPMPMTVGLAADMTLLSVPIVTMSVIVAVNVLP